MRLGYSWCSCEKLTEALVQVRDVLLMSNDNFGWSRPTCCPSNEMAACAGWRKTRVCRCNFEQAEKVVAFKWCGSRCKTVEVQILCWIMLSGVHVLPPLFLLITMSVVSPREKANDEGDMEPGIPALLCSDAQN